MILILFFVSDILLLTMTSKYISSVYVRPNVVTSFDDYYHMINTTAPLDRCYVPLQVILDPDDEPSFKNAFSIVSTTHRFIVTYSVT